MASPIKLRPERTAQFSIGLPTSVRRKLIFVAGERGVSVAALVREFIDAGLSATDNTGHF